MKMNFRAAASLFFAVAFTALTAQAQGQGGPRAAAGGMPAEIAALAARVAALEGTDLAGRVAKLEGHITAADLVGTYALHGIQNELRAAIQNDPNSPPTQVASYVYFGTFELKADGTAVYSSVTEKGNSLILRAPQQVVAHGPAVNNDTITWAYSNGTVTSPGLTPLSVAVGGRLLIGSIAVQNNPGTTVLIIYSRLL